MKHPDQLITDYLEDALEESDQAVLSAWLKADPGNMRRFVDAVRFEQQIRSSTCAMADAAAIASLVTTPSPAGISPVVSPSHDPIRFKPATWIARAAAWVGAFQFIGSTAQGAGAAKSTTLFSKTTLALLMTKNTTIAITTAVLLAGGGAVYLIENNHQEAGDKSARNAAHGSEPQEPGHHGANPGAGSDRSARGPLGPRVKQAGSGAQQKIREEARNAFQEAMKGVSKTMTEAIATRQRARFEGQIQKLAEALSLTEAQKSPLQGWLEDQLQRIRTLDFNDEAATSALLQSLTVRALDEKLAENLTEEQKTSLEDFRERETIKTINAMALKELSRLQGAVEFEGDQQARVYEILTDEAAAKLSLQEENLDPQMFLSDSSEDDKDIHGLGIQQALIAAAAKDPRGIPDYRKVIAEQIAAKVELFRPVLNEKQLEQYRRDLAAKTEESYGPMLELMDELPDGSGDD